METKNCFFRRWSCIIRPMGRCLARPGGPGHISIGSRLALNRVLDVHRCKKNLHLPNLFFCSTEKNRFSAILRKVWRKQNFFLRPFRTLSRLQRGSVFEVGVQHKRTTNTGTAQVASCTTTTTTTKPFVKGLEDSLSRKNHYG